MDKNTIAELQSVLAYDPNTGELTWIVGNSRRKAGDIAGTVGPNGYRYVTYKYKMYLAHQLAWALHHQVWPSSNLDHINRIRTDNKINNLRLCPNNQRENNQNLSRRKDNASGYTGVHYFKRTGQWTAYVNVDGKRKHLGYFYSAEEANIARCEAKSLVHDFHGGE